MAAFDDGKAKQKPNASKVFMQSIYAVAAYTVHQTRRNILYKVLPSSYDKTEIANHTLILTSICTFQIISNFCIGQIDRVVVVIFRSSHQRVLWKLDILKIKSMPSEMHMKEFIL